MSKIYPNRFQSSVHPPRHNQPVSDHLHRRVYGALMGLAAWFLIAIWAFFYGTDYTGILFAVVTGLVAIMIAIPALLWLTWEKAGGHVDDPSRRETFHEWAAGEFKTGSGQIRSAEAITQVLLPIAGVAIGMTLFGLVFYAVQSAT